MLFSKMTIITPFLTRKAGSQTMVLLSFFGWSFLLLNASNTAAAALLLGGEIITTPYSYYLMSTTSSIRCSSRYNNIIINHPLSHPFFSPSIHSHTYRHTFSHSHTHSISHSNHCSRGQHKSSLHMYYGAGAAEFDPEGNNSRRRRRRPFRDEVEVEQKIAAETKVQRPPPIAETLAERHAVQPKNLTPKIIVLGSTGKIGRHVIKNLMSLQQEIKIVAFVRDYDKACDVLYEDLIRENGSRKGRPTLQLVVMNLVPPNEVAGYDPNKKDLSRRSGASRNGSKGIDYDDDDEEDEEEYAVSAARFYNEDVADYDFRSDHDEEDFIDPYQSLYDAMRNATAVISTIGTVRETIPFGDYIMKPWRIFLRPDRWCKDPSHPYYVNYMVMKKVLDCAEREQLRRDQEWKTWVESNDDSEEYDGENYDATSTVIDTDTMRVDSYNYSNYEQETPQQTQKAKKGDRIRIIRISDLCVANPPWDFVTVLTNIIRSLVFRSQERCEKLLEKSELVDTIVLRPGDLVDENRDEAKTALQVDVDGYLPSPCYVGREDVAQLATLASLSKLEPQVKKKQNEKQRKLVKPNGERNKNPPTKRRKSNTSNKMESESNTKAKHWNIAVGWTDNKRTKTTSTTTNPSKSSSKHRSVEKAFQYITRKECNRSKLEEKKIALRNSNPLYKTILGPIRKRIRLYSLQQTKPYGIFVLLPMVFIVYPIICSSLFSIGKRVPILEQIATKIFLLLRPIWIMLAQKLRLDGMTRIRDNSSNQLKKLIY